METMISNARIVLPHKVLEKGWIYFDQSGILNLGEGEAPEAYLNKEIVDARGMLVLPGLIDMHIHGGNGADFMEPSLKGLDVITKFHLMHGTTTLLATTVTASKEQLDAVLRSVDTYRNQPMRYAQIAGVHLEGPFISPLYPGAQNPLHITLPRLDWLESWQEQYPDLIRIVTLAPEIKGALEIISWLQEHGIVAAAGHTDATYEDMRKGMEKGLSHAVHAYNAMRGLHHREPGTVGAVLLSDELSCEVIADGHHVHPKSIELLVKAKGPKLSLITDAVSAAGLSDGIYQLGGLDVALKDGVVRLKDEEVLAGSILTLNQAVRNMVEKVGLPLWEAVKMASLYPAQRLGLEERKGSIEIGKEADLILIDHDFQVKQAWIQGVGRFSSGG